MSALLFPGYGRDVDAWLFLKQLHLGGAGGRQEEWCPGVPWNPWFILKAHIEGKQRNVDDGNLLSRSFTKWDKLKL